MYTKTYKTVAVLSDDGALLINGLPFQKGERVEVFVVMQKPLEQAERYSLRGAALLYHNPFDNVAEEEWGALL